MRQLLLLITITFIYHITFCQSDTMKAPSGINNQELMPPLELKGSERTQSLPQYKGGDKELIWFIQKHITYPEFERNNDIQGNIKVHLIVEKDGSTSGHEIYEGVPSGLGLNEEALRVCRLIKFEKPAIINGAPVRYSMLVPIKFKLEEGNTTEDTWKYVGGLDSLNTQIRNEIISPARKWKRQYKEHINVELQIDDSGKIASVTPSQKDKKISKRLKKEIIEMFQTLHKWEWSNATYSGYSKVLVYDFYIDTEFVAKSKVTKLKINGVL